MNGRKLLKSRYLTSGVLGCEHRRWIMLQQGLNYELRLSFEVCRGKVLLRCEATSMRGCLASRGRPIVLA